MVEHPFDVLGHELDAAARRQIARARRRRPRWPGFAILVGVTGASAVALAAGGVFSSGEPVPYRYGASPRPDTHYGTTVPGSVRLLIDDVRDPGGGLRWGLRSFTTSRGFGCIQVGRVQDGRLGVLALAPRGGQVTGRGLFHVLPEAVAAQATTCTPLDGAGRTFLALRVLVAPDGAFPQCRYRTDGSGLIACRGAARVVDAGLLGPRARTLMLPGGTTRRPAGPDGGYLLVGRAPGHAFEPGMPFAQTPATPAIARVRYAGAPVCVVRVTQNPRGACAGRSGYVAIRSPHVAEVRARVTAFAAPDRRGMRVRFTARAAVTGGRAAYHVLIRFPNHTSYGTDLERDNAAGERIRTTIDLPSLGLRHRPALRPGTYRVEVSYRVAAARGGPAGHPRSPGQRVGTAVVRVR